MAKGLPVADPGAILAHMLPVAEIVARAQPMAKSMPRARAQPMATSMPRARAQPMATSLPRADSGAARPDPGATIAQ